MVTKAVAKKTETALSTNVLTSSAWGAENIDPANLLIPKLLLMQGLSEMVTERKAQQGDIIRSTTKEILSKGIDAGVEFIPFNSFDTWVIEEKIKDKFEYRRTEPVTNANKAAAWEWQEKGSTWRRSSSLNFHVLLPGDIAKEMAAMENLAKTGAMPKPTDAVLPCVVSFKRTSRGAGKDLTTAFGTARHFNIPPSSWTFTLKAKSEKNELGTYYVYTVEQTGMTKPGELEYAKKWYDTVSKFQVKVDDSDLAAEVKVEVSVNPQDPDAEY